MSDTPKSDAVSRIAAVRGLPVTDVPLVSPKDRDALNARKLVLAIATLKSAKFALDSVIMLRGVAELAPYANEINCTLKALGEDVGS